LKSRSIARGYQLVLLISITQGFILQRLEAVLVKAVELEDGKKVSGFVKLVLISIYTTVLLIIFIDMLVWFGGFSNKLHLLLPFPVELTWTP
jgi:hypothetical protein